MSRSDPLDQQAQTVRRRRGGLLGPLMRRTQSVSRPPQAYEPPARQIRAAEPEPAGHAPGAWVPDVSTPPEPEESPSPRSETGDAPRTETGDAPRSETDDAPRSETDDAPRTEVEEPPRRETEDVPAEIAPSTPPAGWQHANGTAEARSTSDSPAAPSELDRSTWVPFEDHHLRRGMPLDNGHHAADEWLPPDERPPASPRDPEVEHRRFRAVNVFCERFCDPARADAKAAQALELFDTRIRRRPNADGHSANLELLRITRTVAAEAPMLDDHPDGWRDGHADNRADARRAGCVRASELLAARANDEIDEAGRARLEDHLRECDSCLEVERRMLDAEQAFVTALEADEPAPVAVDAPRVVVSDPRRAAVEAYCDAVCATTAAAAAADAWSAFGGESGALAEIPAEEEELRLAALTRAVAARHLSDETADDPHNTPACVATPRMLAARLNGLIDEDEFDALEQHVRRCETCSDIQARMTAAERLWSRELGHPLTAAVALPVLGERDRRVRAALIAVPAAIAGVVLAIVLVSSSGSSNPAATTAPSIAQQVAITSSATTSAATHRTRHHVNVVHKPHRRAAAAAKPPAAAAPTTTSSATFTQATATAPQQTTPATFTPPPTPASPPPSSPPPATTSTPAQPGISNPGSAIGAAPAPQHHIGGGH